jgi:lysophospholipase
VEGETRLAAAVLSAPMVKVATGKRPYGQSRAIAWLMARAGRATEYVLGEPNNPFEHTFEANALTRDRERYERWRGQLHSHPDLGLGGVTWGWLDFAFRASARLLFRPGLEAVKTPVTIVAASEDQVVDNAALRTTVERLPHARLVEVSGSLHEILMETDDKRAQFFDAFDEAVAELAPTTSPTV